MIYVLDVYYLQGFHEQNDVNPVRKETGLIKN